MESSSPKIGEAEHRDIVVIGASAGGVDALDTLVRQLPAELQASIFVVLHLLSPGKSMLAAILERAGRLPAHTPEDGERIERGQIYVAEPDVHLLIEDRDVRLSRGPRENGHRPAIDPLFRSAARAHGRRVIAIVLSGALDDGAAGLRFVKDHGGVAIVQDPADAQYPSMPENAILGVEPDHIVRAQDMGELIGRLLEEPLPREDGPRPVADGGEATATVEPLPLDPEYPSGAQPGGQPAGLTCPECGGSLWEMEDGPLVRFACRVGHAYSPDSLVTEQSRSLESALWSALQSLEERVDILRRMARRAEQRGSQRIADRFEIRARATEDHAGQVRGAIAAMADPDRAPDESQSAA